MMLCTLQRNLPRIRRAARWHTTSVAARRPACPRCGNAGSPPCAFFCECGSIQDVCATCSHFSLLGLTQRFDVAVKDIHEAYKALQRKLHPDVHHAAAVRAAEEAANGDKSMALFSPDDIAALAAAHSSRINVAADVLYDPVLRIQHLMVTQFNVDPLAEDAGSSLSDPELLMFVMEERQRIEDLDDCAGSSGRSRHINGTLSRIA